MDAAPSGFDASLFAKLTGESGQDQRRHPRIVKPGRITLRVSYQRQPLTVRLRDISVGGIGFLHSEAIEAGTTFVIEPPKGCDAKSIRYKVVRCVPRGGGQFEIGAQILHVKRHNASGGGAAAEDSSR
jgi:hypothetical protein